MQKRWKLYLFFSIFFLLLVACQQNQEQTETPIQVRNQEPYDSKTVQRQKTELNKLYKKQTEKKKEQAKKFKRQEIRGIYLNPVAINQENIDKYVDLVKSSPRLNAVVFDLKDDNGRLTYQSNVNLVNEIGADKDAVIDDLESFIQRLKDEGIYTIARIVTFKDPYLAEKKPEWALQNRNGSPWIGPNGIKWIDPYKEEMWDYIFNIVEEIAQSGIDEIQYDYIRFPENAVKVDQQVQYANNENLSKGDLIEKFLIEQRERLSNYPVLISADVFGLVTSSADDMGIGQRWEEFSPYVDFISPMTYPSHYSANNYGLPNPNNQPYELIKAAMEDAIERNEKLKEKHHKVATIRPWLQDFGYTKDQVLKQIKALNDLGINEYLLWNSGSDYTPLD